ncbi:MAG: DICT sensory domain-containing protein [Cyanobacteria bacterium P01_D01_bin.50]
MLEGSVLQRLQKAHQNSKRPIRYGVYYKNTLVALCHALEDHILNDDSKPLVITAFQQGKWYLEEAERYAEIAKCSQQIAIMAAPDSGWLEHPTSKLLNVDLVAIKPEDAVAEEWHLIILSPKYTAMVICQELSSADYGSSGQPESDLERKFYGLWTFEPDLVRETARIAINHIESYNPQLAKKLHEYEQEIKPNAATSEELATVVSRVVDYLQVGKTNISVPAGNRHRILDRNLFSNEIQAFLRMAQLLDAADMTNPTAGTEVVALSETMGQLLDLPAWQMKRLRLAGYLHRIHPLQTAKTILTPGISTTYKEDAPSCALTCPLVPGTQVLRTMPRLRAVAQIITHQSEWWDGTGSPAGLGGDEIPLESRILALIADFQSRVNEKFTSGFTKEETLTQALEECSLQQSTRFDPKLIETLTLLVMGLHQGLELPVITPKFSAGIWLLDNKQEEMSEFGEIRTYLK